VSASDVILEAQGLSKEFQGFCAVKDVDLVVRRGSVHALIGPNGAGKTTVFNLLTGFVPPTAGRIAFNGIDITGEPPVQVARRGMVRSFQISATFPHLTLLENVRIALQRKMGNSLHFWEHESRLNCLNEQALQLLEAVDLRGLADRITVELPQLMLLDEPTQGMGHEDVSRVVELIRKVARNRTILMVEHNLSVVETLSDVITVLQRGSILAQGPYSVVSRDPRVLEAYVGVEA